MISPIIALRDDQREAFLRELDGDENFPEGYKLNSKFITVVEEDMVQVKTDLIKGDVGMLCCSPEHIFIQLDDLGWSFQEHEDSIFYINY